MLIKNSNEFTPQQNNYPESYCFAIERGFNFMIVYNSIMYIGFVLMLWERLGMFKNVDTILYDTLWNALKYYSYAQSCINKNVVIPFHSKSKNLYKQLKCFFVDAPHKYIIVRNGKEIMRFKKINGLLTYYLLKCKNSDEDELICYRNDENVYYTNINEFIYRDNIMKNGDYDNNIELIEKSSIKFMTCHITIKVKDKNLFVQREIVLDNFMLVGSKILDKSFVLWYCNKYFDFDIDLIESYKIDIIDQDVDQIEIDMNDYIEIHENEYVIHKKKHMTNKDSLMVNDNDNDEDTPVNDLDRIINEDNPEDADDENSTHNNKNDDSSDDSNSEINNADEKVIEIPHDYKCETDCEYHKQLDECDSELFDKAIDEYKNSSMLSRFMLF